MVVGRRRLLVVSLLLLLLALFLQPNTRTTTGCARRWSQSPWVSRLLLAAWLALALSTYSGCCLLRSIRGGGASRLLLLLLLSSEGTDSMGKTRPCVLFGGFDCGV